MRAALQRVTVRGEERRVYLRHATVKKDGKVHRYWRLVRSVRRGSKVVQEVVAHLGELDEKGRAQAKALARETSPGVRAPSGSSSKPRIAQSSESRSGSISFEWKNGRAFGNVWLGWKLWRALKLDECCAQLMPRGREIVPGHAMAALHVIARLCEPSSDLHIAEDWYRKTALGDILGVPDELVNDDRVYRALDALLPHKEKIEQHLKNRLGELFNLNYDLLLYDVTSTYFEGEMANNPQAQRGYSRDNRPDCKQLCIALVVTKEGVPLGYEIFDGNRTDITTVEEVVSTMERRFGKADRVWVMDRGMGSEDNLAWFAQTGRRYLVGTPKAELKKWEQQLLDEKDWQAVREGLEVKLCPGPQGPETFILCRSADRQKKEEAMHDKFAAHILAGLESLKRRLEKRKSPEDRRQGRATTRATPPAEFDAPAGGFQIEVKEDATQSLRPVALLVDERPMAGVGRHARRGVTSCARISKAGRATSSGARIFS